MRLSELKFRNLASVAALCGALIAPNLASAQPQWSQYGGNAQHTAETTHPVQRLSHILWSTPVDLFPPYNGGTLGIHYGSSLVAHNGTVVVTVRTGPNATPGVANNTFRVEGHDPVTGTTTWTQTTDYNDPPHDWIPSMGSALGPDNKLYTPGAGGTVYVRSDADSASATVTQLCFYGLATYNGNQTLYNSDVRICTPITVDSSGNIYFGYFVTSGSTTGMKSGLARISSTGVGTYVSADSASGFSGMEVGTNCTPALSNDEQYVYVAVKAQGVNSYSNPYLLRLNSASLTTASQISLITGNPGAAAGGTNFSWILDDSTSSPVVGPDGDVFFGVWYNNLSSRGFMMHYSSDLSTFKNAGAFGWDDTASIVPASAVPGYSGSSSYLILTKYNNYADPGVYGDGKNRIALLDPNATQSYTVQYGSHHNPANATGPTYTVMKEVMTVLGITANTETYSDSTPLDGVREWCINSAVIDVAGKAAIINCEDGHCYRWDFTTGALTDNLSLAPPTGEAYTPTISNNDGIAFAVNNAQVLAMWDGAKPGSVGLSSSNIAAGDSASVTINLTDDVSNASTTASGAGATITLTSSNPNITVPASVLVPAGSSSVSFSASTTLSDTSYTGTITASRYGRSATSSTLTAHGSGLNTLALALNPIYPQQNGGGTVTLVGTAPTAGRTVTLSSNLSQVYFDSTSVTFSGGQSSKTFVYHTNPTATTTSGTITATLDDSTTLTQPITIHAPVVDHLVFSPSSVAGGQTTQLFIVTNYQKPAGGINVNVTYSAHTSGPATVNVPQNSNGVATVTTSSVASAVTETVTVSYESSSASQTITINPPGVYTGFTVSNNNPYMTYAVTGTVSMSSAAGGNVSFSVTPSDSGYVLVMSTPTVLSGQTSATFKLRMGTLNNANTHATTVTVTGQGKSFTQTLTIQPFFVNSIATSPTLLHSGQNGTGTVTLQMAPGDYALPVYIYCPSNLITIPQYCNVPQGSPSGTFSIHVNTVTKTTRVAIYAFQSGSQRSTFLTLSP